MAVVTQQDLMEAKRSIDALLSRLPNREDLSRNDNKFIRDWQESDHPRDKDGKFASEGGVEALSQMTNSRLRREFSDIFNAPNEIFIPSTRILMGEAFRGYKGTDAINKLLKERRGHCPDAFSRPGRFEHIALMWGNKHRGLAHLIKRRIEEKQDLAKLLKTMDNVIREGEIYTNYATSRYEIRKDRKIIVLEEVGNAYGNSEHYILTAYKEN
jgi:hypothetical protein